MAKYGQRYNRKTFVEESKLVHGDRYDYSKVNFINVKTNIIIICSIHGEFEQKPRVHLYGSGCPLCNAKKMNTDSFIVKSKEIHGEKYDYSKVNYEDSKKNVIITCPEHGEFKQLPTNHLSGKGCPKCSYNSRILKKTKSYTDFVNGCNIIHHSKFDYSKTIYTNCKDKVIIGCSIHGEFEQTPDAHLRGQGCPKCRCVTSKKETEVVDFIKLIYNKKITENDKKIINPLELDIYLPESKLAIEFDGLYWHSELFVENNYHLNKTNQCNDKGIKLIHIFEDEWTYKQDIVKSILKNKLGLIENKIFGRKCEIKEVNTKESNVFLNNNHIQGAVKSSINIGLYYNDKLVSLICFNKPRSGIGTKYDGYELSRFCNILDTNVIGGASKLLSYFEKVYKPEMIKSYADLRWSDGGLYDKLGFEKSHINKPNYWYIKGNKRKHRFGFRKSILKKDGFDIINKTEHQIMLDRGIYRVYDCGTLSYKKIYKYERE